MNCHARPRKMCRISVFYRTSHECRDTKTQSCNVVRTQTKIQGINSRTVGGFQYPPDSLLDQWIDQSRLLRCDRSFHWHGHLTALLLPLFRVDSGCQFYHHPYWGFHLVQLDALILVLVLPIPDLIPDLELYSGLLRVHWRQGYLGFRRRSRACLFGVKG
jgi:hypothetical protein